jgi:hypothetical protein
MTEDGRDRAVFEREAVDDLGEMTDTRIYEGDLEARPPDADQPDRSVAESLEMLESTELRRGETDNPDEAAEEGLTYVPPTDPPVVGTEDDGDPRIASGFGSTADSEPFDSDHHGTALPAEDEVTARVREALLASAPTSGYADTLAIDTEGGVVRLTGLVADLDDETSVLEVVSGVTGVVDIDNALTVDGLG